MVRECSIAAARSVMFQGLTRMAPAPSDWAAPANSLSTNTPAQPGLYYVSTVMVMVTVMVTVKVKVKGMLMVQENFDKRDNL
jgi:hypothetical protein